MAEPISTERFLTERVIGQLSMNVATVPLDGWYDIPTPLAPLTDESKLIRLEFLPSDMVQYLDSVVVALNLDTSRGIVAVSPERVHRQDRPLLVRLPVPVFAAASRIQKITARVKFLWNYRALRQSQISGWTVRLDELIVTDTAVPFTPEWMQDQAGKVVKILVDQAGRALLTGTP